MITKRIFPALIIAALFSACNSGTENSGSDAEQNSVEFPAEQPSESADQGTADPSATDVAAEGEFKIDASNQKSGKVLTVNPPHGEPGHRCEIAVGAPLNSPATTPAATAPATSPVVAPSTAPAAAPSISAPVQSSGTSGKLNPAHGEPGHRCDIAVGAPL